MNMIRSAKNQIAELTTAAPSAPPRRLSVSSSAQRVGFLSIGQVLPEMAAAAVREAAAEAT